MHDPREQHLVAIKRILRYVKGTLPHGLQLNPMKVPTGVWLRPQ
jgi:hypothetical protein